MKKQVEGFINLELLDVKTNKKEIYNIKNALTEEAQRQFLNVVVQQVAGGTSFTNLPSYSHLFTNCILFNLQIPNVDFILPGSTVAYSTQGTYAGTDTRQGTINTAESYIENKFNYIHIHYVFDWPTNSGNGMFNAVLWAPWVDQEHIFHSTILWGFADDPFKIGGFDLDEDGNIYRTVLEGWFDPVKLKRGNDLIATIGVTNWPGGLVYKNGQLYIGYDRKIHVYNLSGQYQYTLPTPSDIYIHRFDFLLNGNIVAVNMTTNEICFFSQTGSFLRKFNSPVPSITSVTGNQNFLYLSKPSSNTRQHFFYMVDMDGTLLGSSTIYAPRDGENDIKFRQNKLFLMCGESPVGRVSHVEIQDISPIPYGTLAKLPQPIVKNNNQTMKLTYDIYVRV